MSTEYEFRCLKCDETLRDSYEWRYGDLPSMEKVLLNASVFAAVGNVVDDPDFYLTMGGHDLWELPKFFAEHEGHEIAIFDEYGERHVAVPR